MKQEFFRLNILPIGVNRFGNVYQWNVSEPLEAVMFMLGLKDGYIKDVFWSEVLGSIDLAWGNDKGGFCHIVQKHLIESDDFSSVREIVGIIQNTFRDGKRSEQGSNVSFDYEQYRVSVARSEEGNWVLTAFDKSRTRKEKER